MSSNSVYINPSTGSFEFPLPIGGSPQFTNNVDIGGSISAKNVGMFRNRIINGDMSINQRGTCNYAVNSLITSVAVDGLQKAYTVDRFALVSGPASGSINAAQVSLNATDQAAIGGDFTKAVMLSPSPVSDLVMYFPFENSSNDASGSGYGLTQVGSPSFVPGRVGDYAVYLANENNITAGTPTAAANKYYLSNGTYTLPTNSQVTITCWVYFTKLSIASQASCVWNIAASGGTPYIELINNAANLYAYAGGATATSSIVIYQWYHTAVVFNPGTSVTFYLNGSSIGTSTSSISAGGQASVLTIGDNQYALRPFAGFIDDFRIYHRALSAAEISQLAGSIAQVSQLPSVNPTIRLTFDNTTADAQGTVAAPTTTGTVAYAPSGRAGTYSLNLTGNAAGGTPTTTLTYAYTLTNTTPFTVSFWVNMTSVVNYQYLINFLNSGGSDIFHFIASTNGIYIEGVGNTVSTAVGYSSYVWYHIVGVFPTSGLVQIYANGILKSTTDRALASFMTATTTQFRVGGFSTNGSFKGYIDDFRIYNNATLTSSQIAALYHSYNPSTYILYQQPIEGLHIADFAYGTSKAQSSTVSCWLKNNTTALQQFTLSATNSGSACISAITFEGSSSNDTLKFLLNPTPIGTITYSSSVYKVGTQSLDLTANTPGSAPTTGINYSLTAPLSIPVSMSVWFYCTLLNSQTQRIVAFGINIANTWGYQIYISSSNKIVIDLTVNNTFYGIASELTITTNRWYHICSVVANGTHSMYINGTLNTVNSTVPTTGILQANANVPLSEFHIGHDIGVLAFKGYVDDFRLYNRGLTATEVYQIYTANANSTVISNYLLPRTYLYTTPSIPAGSWQKVAFTIPGDSNGTAFWQTDTNTGMILSLCLGAGSTYAGSANTWLSDLDYTQTGVQIYGASSNNFLANCANSIYITGLQLEKGTAATMFEFRPYSVEKQLSERYYQLLRRKVVGYVTYTGYVRLITDFKEMRTIPSVDNNNIQIQYSGWNSTFMTIAPTTNQTIDQTTSSALWGTEKGAGVENIYDIKLNAEF